MSNDWTASTVAELQAAGHLLVEDGNHGEYRPRPEEFNHSGVSFIRAADMDGGQVLFSTASRINATALARIRKGIGAPGDVLLSHKGTVGKVAFAPLDCQPFVCSPQTTFWRVRDTGKLDRRYLYYYLCSTPFKQQLASLKGETDMADYVSLTVQRTLKVIIPPIYEQRFIARVIGSLDDKIDLNRRMNDTLEAIARALFRSWFVDFDPVRAKMEGREPAGMDEETAAIFPDRFEDSSLGPIPAGWRVRTIDEATSLIIDYRGKTPKKLGHDWSQAGIAAISAKNIKQGRLVEKQSMNFVGPDLYDIWMKDKLAVGDILMTSEAPLGELLYLARGADLCLSQRVFALRSNPAECLHTYLYLWMTMRSSQERLQSRATGTTVLGIRQSELRKIEVLLPSMAVQKKLHPAIAALLSKVASNEAETETLGALRDTLLPKLLSGEIRVKDLQSTTGAC